MFGFWSWRLDYTVDEDDLPNTARWTPPSALVSEDAQVCAQCGAETGSDAVNWCRYECARLWHDQRKGAA